MPRLLLLAALCLGWSVAARSADVTVAGSDLLRPVLQRLEGAKTADARTVRVRLDGTRAALADLRAGRADLAVVTFAPGEALPDTEFRLVPLAYQVVVVVVNAANPVAQLNYAQLGGLFGEREAANLRRWGAVGAADAWADKSVGLGLVTGDGSLAIDLFCHTVLATPQLRTAVVEYRTADELLRKIRADDSMIGLLPGLVPAEAGVRALSLAREPGDVPFGPTPGNIQAGDYPLRLPFYLAVRPQAGPELAPVLELLLSEATAAEFERGGYVPALADARAAARQELLRR